MPVVLYGFSLGAGIGLRCASERELPIAGVILEAPYRFAHTPAESVMRARGVPVRGVLWPALAMIGLRLPNGPRWRGFDRRAIAARVACPVLVIHGDRDAICPLADGRAIAESARDGRLAIIEGAGHNDLWTVPAHVDRTTRAIGDFLHGTRSVAPPTGHPPPKGDRSGMPDIDGDV
jgi:pimeloyl-ACP methyl ester carboxylesterase